MGKSHDLATLKDDGGQLGYDASDTTFFGTRGTLLSTDTHIGHNIYYDSGWTTINSAEPSSSIRLGGDSGTSNEIRFQQADAGSSVLSTRMTIDASGRVTMPYQPAFRAWKDATSWTVASTFVFDQTEYNVGGHYSTSTGRFTAPVTGVYHFDFYTIEYGNINNGYIRFWVNNARPYGGDVHFTTNEGSYWDYVGWHGDYKLDAGDYVEFITAQSHTYHGRNWSSFSGHLVG